MEDDELGGGTKTGGKKERWEGRKEGKDGWKEPSQR